jgi:hypothetical protein
MPQCLRRGSSKFSACTRAEAPNGCYVVLLYSCCRAAVGSAGQR